MCTRVYVSAYSASEEKGESFKGCLDIVCILSNYTVYGCSYGQRLYVMTCNALSNKNYKDNITSTLSHDTVKHVSDTSKRVHAHKHR